MHLFAQLTHTHTTPTQMIENRAEERKRKSTRTLNNINNNYRNNVNKRKKKNTQNAPQNGWMKNGWWEWVGLREKLREFWVAWVVRSRRGTEIFYGICQSLMQISTINITLYELLAHFDWSCVHTMEFNIDFWPFIRELHIQNHFFFWFLFCSF